MRKVAFVGFAAAVLLNAGQGAATQSDAASQRQTQSSTLSGLTVTAPPKPNPLVSPESQFVRSHLPEGISEQFPRFRDDVCVNVQGLPAEFDAFIAKRIVEIATEVHAPLARAADCVANVHVIFTTQPQAQLDDIAKRKDILVGFHFASQLKRLTSVNRPIQAWYVTRTRDTTGNSWIEVAHSCPLGAGNGLAECGDRPIGRAGSRLGNDMSAEVVHSLILADSNKVAGEKIDAIADYVAVLALAKWQGLERCNAIPTILNLMADGCNGDAPEGATPADLSLLKGLYAVDPRELGSQQRATIASAMRAAAATSSKIP